MNRTGPLIKSCDDPLASETQDDIKEILQF